MITKEQEITKYGCLYVSNFHLEMILLPYLKRKINKSKIIVFTEENLLDSLEILLEKINLKIEDKKEILKIKNWNVTKQSEIPEGMEEYTIVINGNKNYRKEIYNKIKEIKSGKISIIDCYDIGKCEVDVEEIRNNYEFFLNTEAV